MTAGRSWRSARLLVASTPSWSVKGKEMIALFMEAFAHGFFVRFAARRLQQLNGFVLEGLTQIAKDFQAKVGFLLSECDGGAQHGFHFA